eukprot:gene10067-biopygen2556
MIAIAPAQAFDKHADSVRKTAIYTAIRMQDEGNASVSESENAFIVKGHPRPFANLQDFVRSTDSEGSGNDLSFQKLAQIIPTGNFRGIEGLQIADVKTKKLYEMDWFGCTDKTHWTVMLCTIKPKG